MCPDPRVPGKPKAGGVAEAKTVWHQQTPLTSHPAAWLKLLLPTGVADVHITHLWPASVSTGWC